MHGHSRAKRGAKGYQTRAVAAGGRSQALWPDIKHALMLGVKLDSMCEKSMGAKVSRMLRRF